MRRTLPLLPILVAGFLLPGTGEGQGVPIDEGTFRILVDGQEVGRETFSIRRAGSGADAQVIATAEIEMEVPEGRLDLRPALEALGEDMAVSAYQIKVSGSRQEEVYVTLGDRRFVTRIRTEQGQQEREYRAAPGTLLLDSRAAHQYYFVSHRAGTNTVTVPVIVPRENRQYDLGITVIGTESIRVGDVPTEARRLLLEGDGSARDLWVDSEGRVLRLAFQDESYVAVRERLP
jgi:hypothetical protein